MKLKEFLILFIIFIVALGIRFYGIGWDNFQHLHPDERYLTMVATDIKEPRNIIDYFNTKQSPLNPYNYEKYKFFVYGTFPIFIVKYLSEISGPNTYDKVFIYGRCLTIFVDSLNIFLLFYLSRLILKEKKKLVFLPSLFYCFMVLPIQTSHFFTVDPFLNFFILLSFTLLCHSSRSHKSFILSAVAFGLAVSSKISAIYFAPIIFLYFLLFKKPGQISIKKITTAVLFFIISFAVFRVTQPYSFIGIFTPNPDFINSLRLLNTYSQPNGYYPPSVMWLSKKILIFPLENIALWGIGLPFFILFIYGLFRNIFKYKFQFIKQLFVNIIIFLSLFWITALFLYQGSRFVYNLRYFLPIYPFICITTVWFLEKIRSRRLLLIGLLTHIFWCILFLNIYRFPHTRVESSSWIYNNIPPSSVVTSEYWDDGLPLNVDYHTNLYVTKSLKLYDEESVLKWQTINQQLKESDYIILSSNRLWGSIPKVPKMYPQTAKFYQNLFDGKSEFTKYKEFDSYPGISLPFIKKCFYLGYTDYPYKTQKNNFLDTNNNCLHPGIYLRDDTAEESFTVYDHPKVLIFKKKSI